MLKLNIEEIKKIANNEMFFNDIDEVKEFIVNIEKIYNIAEDASFKDEDFGGVGVVRI